MTDAAKAARPYTRRTLAAQALGKIDEATRAVVPPIHIATTFIRDPDNQYRSGNIYGRPDNATVREAEEIICALEGAAVSMVLGSGMSAATAVFLALSPGDHIVAPNVMYWALRSWLMNDAAHCFGGFPHEQRARPPFIWILQRETAPCEDDERYRQQNMLQPFQRVHAQLALAVRRVHCGVRHTLDA